MEERKLLIDLHCHTIASGHAYSTVKENIEWAKKKGLKYVGISDHGPNMPGGAHIYHFTNLHAIKSSFFGIEVLKGAEANIVDYEGNIDIPQRVCEKLDYIIASLHLPCLEAGTKEENTRAIIKAMENESVNIIGHPDDSRYELDYEVVVKEAKRTNTLLEINNSSLKPNSFRIGARENVQYLLRLCERGKVKVIFGSDAHIFYDIGNFKYCEEIVEMINFPKNLIVNYDSKEIEKILNINLKEIII